MREIGKKARASLKGGSLHTSGGQSQGNNRYLQCIEDFRQTLPEDRRDLPLSQEQNERIWLDTVGGPSRYGYAYGLPQLTFCEFHSELEGVGSFQDDESRETILALKQQITKLSSKAKASQARERKRDIQYAGMKAQFDALLASGEGGSPCPGD
ncbi:hypothetical protein CQW23_28220 [Capsicum baccatum]|uniref:Uncharacterized protein n=1 Tax=Capsicum baccatum TaxID=33114 RepID=A0A2G2VFY3_CAPBA|nr:hypothetical protein CQW23_28220 [Capsicum baccatum]